MSIHYRAALAVLAATAAPVAAAPDKLASNEIAREDDQLYSCKAGKGPVSVTFKPETELKDLITWAMSFTCKGFMLDPRVTLTGKKVTLIVPTKLSPQEAYQVFLAALATVGVTVVPKGPVMRIVDAGIARHDTVPLYKKGLPDNLDQIVRYVYRPSYAQVETLRTAFTALKTDTGDVIPVGSLVVITDYATNVRDMMSLAKLIDVPGGTDGIYTIPIRHADATKLAPKLEQFLGVSAATGTAAPPKPRPDGAPAAAAASDIASAVPSKIMVDERTNTLVVAASDAAYQRLRAIVDRLDIALEIEGGATFHVYPLGHAIAEELAATMSQAISGSAPQQPKQPAAGGPKPVTPPPAPSADGGAALEGPVRVIGEKATNSLIVMSSGRDFLAIRDIIRQLDLPRRQVYIEAMILELGMEQGMKLGISGHTGLPTKQGTVALTGVQLPGASTLTTEGLAESAVKASGLVGAVMGPLLNTTGLGVTIPSYAVLFQAVANSSRTNVLSAPSIIAVDNEEAKYKVGSTIFINKGTTFTPAGTATPNIQPTDVALELTIKPHVSNDDSILLELTHNAEEVIGENALGPIISKRNFQTRVVVGDQQTVVIGGLMQERTEHKTVRVPILGDIPILGHLFKYTQTGKRKTNLVILLTPYIIKDQLDLQTLRDRKLREHDEFESSLENLRSTKYAPRMDYRRKRGVVEEINRVLLDIEADTAARKALREPPAVTPGPIEYAPKPD